MPTDVSSILALPYIQPAQAQKHVTHNEAIRVLDVLVQLTVLSRQTATPPISPTPGMRFIVPTGAAGAFLGQEHKIAFWDDNTWSFFDALPGWHAEVQDEKRRVVFDGQVWLGPEATVHRVLGLGIAADADSVNRLSVTSPATLLTHDGAGHQLKINKAAASETASLLFQTGWSGRAEMGTIGSDSFAIKTSADGVAFQVAMQTQPQTGRVDLPSGTSVAKGTSVQPGLAFLGDEDTGIFSALNNQIGFATNGLQRAVLTDSALSVSVPISGPAVTQTATDMTAGRLVKTGDFGLGEAITLGAGDNLDTLIASGFYYNSTAANTTGNNYPIGSAGSLLNLRRSSTNWTQRFSSYPGTSLASQVRTFERSFGGSGWSPWVEIFHQGSILGTVSQSGGVPTGRVIERGSNANGGYVRFADGTQICTGRRVIKAASDATVGVKSASWTYPASFQASPEVRPTILTDRPDQRGNASTSTPGTTAATIFYHEGSGIAADVSASLTAIGRWF